MQKDLGNYRKSYEKSALDENSISDNPMEVFQKWFYEVEESNGVDEANAMTISTVGIDGFPKNRVVLLKKYTYEGFSKLKRDLRLTSDKIIQCNIDTKRNRE